MTPLSPEEERRTARQTLLIGRDAQQRLHDSHVLVVGAGGLGCPALQQLVAGGIGRITLIDDDVVDLTNIHRQILFGAEDVGRPKAEVAAARVRDLQPGVDIEARCERLTADNALALVGAADLVLDGSDTYATKYLVADACEMTSTPLVWGTVLRFHGDVALFHSGADTPDGRGVGLRDLLPSPPSDTATCETAGVLGATTSVVGGLMATAALGFLSKLDAPVGRVTSYDAFPPLFRTLTVGADPARPLVTHLPEAQEADAYAQWPAAVLDIREYEERLVVELTPPPGTRLVELPFSRIHDDAHVADALRELDAADVAVLCALGKKSAAFALRYEELANTCGTHLHNIDGGARVLGSYLN